MIKFVVTMPKNLTISVLSEKILDKETKLILTRLKKEFEYYRNLNINKNAKILQDEDKITSLELIPKEDTILAKELFNNKKDELELSINYLKPDYFKISRILESKDILKNNHTNIHLVDKNQHDYPISKW